MLGFVWKGILIGILVSAPMGPIGMLCIQRTLSKGRWHGFVSGLGATLSDVIYALITGLGMGMVVNFIEANQTPLQFGGSIVIAIFGYYIFQTNPVKSLRKPKETKHSFTQDFLSAFLLTFSNALILFLFIGLYARFGFVLPEQSFWMMMAGVGCIAIGAIAWWFFITYLVSKLKKWFNIRGIWLLNKIVGSIIMVVAAVGILSVIFAHCFQLPILSIFTQ